VGLALAQETRPWPKLIAALSHVARGVYLRRTVVQRATSLEIGYADFSGRHCARRSDLAIEPWRALMGRGPTAGV
jgi:hypothetical protein